VRPLVALERFARLFDGLDEPEGVAVADNGAIWCGGREGQVYRGLRPDPARIVARLPGRVLGIALDASGDAYCCCLGDRPGLFRVSPAGTTTRVLADVAERHIVAPNHPAFLPDGRLAVTDSGHDGADDGCLLAIEHDGTAGVLSEAVRRYPNGLAVSPDGTFLAVVESGLPGISALPLAPDGRVGARHVLTTLPNAVPDGVAFDARGRLLVSCFSPSRIYLVQGQSPRLLADDPLERVLHAPTNVAFVPGARTVICANLRGSSLAVFEHDTPGAALIRPPGIPGPGR
jgi:gluconolactonase